MDAVDEQAVAMLVELEQVWKHSDTFFFEHLPEGEMMSQPIDLRNPFLFYLGHLPAFAWNKARTRLSLKYSNNPQYDYIFERGIDPDVDDPTQCHSHPEAPPTWPTTDQVVAYRDWVRNEFRSQFQGSKDGLRRLKEMGVFDMIVEHELMHIETLYYMLAQLKPENKPIIEMHFEGITTDAKFIHIPAGKAILGLKRAPELFGWDNEFDEHQVHVEHFRISELPVTIGQFSEFVADGGYYNGSYWTERDWEWRQKHRIEYPSSWRKLDGSFDGSRGNLSAEEILSAYCLVGPLGKTSSLKSASNCPVFCSLTEARAYAKYKNCRLPTEAEWHRAAFGDSHEANTNHGFPWQGNEPIPEKHGNFGMIRTRINSVNQYPNGNSRFGVADLFGNGWELTSTVFEPFEGFQISEDYPNYSSDFFDGKHFVLKGASWATHPKLIRRSFRNWYQDHYPYVFAKFRLVQQG